MVLTRQTLFLVIKAPFVTKL